MRVQPRARWVAAQLADTMRRYWPAPSVTRGNIHMSGTLALSVGPTGQVDRRPAGVSQFDPVFRVAVLVFEPIGIGRADLVDHDGRERGAGSSVQVQLSPAKACAGSAGR